MFIILTVNLKNVKFAVSRFTRYEGSEQAFIFVFWSGMLRVKKVAKIAKFCVCLSQESGLFVTQSKFRV